MCSNREPPANGRVTVEDGGSTALYKCNDGYQLVGHRRITCQDNGEWNEQAPTCCERGMQNQIIMSNYTYIAC